jgi:CubicO group peptidase (beta-lactamase class C family)
VDRHTLAGAVALVATKDKVLAVATAGFADIAAQKAMAPDAIFWIASQSKPITATALMMLVDEGKVNVEDPVEKYLPEFRGQMVIAEQDDNHMLLKKPTHPVKVREILSHTSGFRFSSPMEQPTLDGLPLRDAVRSHALCRCNGSPARSTNTATPASTLPHASSRWLAEWHSKIFWPNACSSHSA